MLTFAASARAYPRFRATRRFAAGLAAALVVGCSGGGPSITGVDTGPLHFAGAPDSVAIRPGESRTLEVVVLDAGDRPLNGRVVEFAIVAPPGGPADTAKGATLSGPQALSNAEGRASVTILAGLPTAFRVRVEASRADSIEIPVFVSAGLTRSAEIAPVVASAGGPTLSGITLRIYEGTTCASLDLDRPLALPESVRPEHQVAPSGRYVFDALSVTESHAVVGLGRDANGVVAYAGCLDLAGSLLLENHTVRIFLPLARLVAKPPGSYSVTLELQFAAAPPAAMALADAWKSLSRCPLDPAQIWLDCTVDALSTTPDDPVDCRPAADEGALAAQLAAHRGMANLPAAPGCRADKDAQGRPSLESALRPQFSPASASALAALPTLASEIATLFTRFRLSSAITISAGPASARDGQYALDHTLTSLEMAVGSDPVSVSLLALGAPSLSARFVNAHLSDGLLQIVSHGFAARLGSAFRQGFRQKALIGRMLPATEAALVDGLFAAFAAPGPGSTKTGCDGLDEVLCGSVGAPPGCLAEACGRGLQALTQQLGAGFTALDGTDLDLFLGGAAKVVDDDGDQRVDRLGQLLAGSTGPGLWTGEVKSRAGSLAVSGIWVGNRQGTP